MILNDTIIESIGWTILHSFWQIMIIGLIVKVLLLIYTNRPSVYKYNIALAGLFAIIISSAITIFIYLPGTYSSVNELSGSGSQIIQSIPLEINKVQLAQTSNSIFDHASAILSKNMVVIVSLWFMGVFIFSLRFAGSYWYIQRLKSKYSSPVKAEWLNLFAKISKNFNIHKKINLLESANTKVPIVIGHLKPAIILPLGLVSSIPYNQLEAILIHELAHIKRSDYFINIVRSILGAIFFYHPVFWWLSNIINIERENICDDISIQHCGTKKHLQHALADIYNFNQKSIPIVAALYKNNYQLLKRIKRMKTKNQSNHGKHGGLIGISILLAGTILIGITSAFSPRLEDIPDVNDPPVIQLFPDIAVAIGTTEKFPAQASLRPDISTPDSNNKPIKDGTINLELDSDGNLISVSKGGKKLTGEEQKKYKKMVAKLKEIDDEEQANRENQEELERVKLKLEEVQSRMDQVHTEYDRVMEEYVKLSQEIGSTIFSESRSIYEDQLLPSQELAELAKKETILSDLHSGRYYSGLFDANEYTRSAENNYWEQLELQKEHHDDLLRAIDMEQFSKGEEFIQQMYKSQQFENRSTVLESGIRAELVEDGIINDYHGPLDFELSKKKLVVNGKKQSSEKRDKYLNLYSKLSNENLQDKMTLRIID